MEAREISVHCCIAGGGPAGMMLGFLLARAGVSVLVLEKHADFLRDFRGDTIHPSTLEIMHELGVLGEFLQRPHQEAPTLSGQVGEESVEVANFTSLPTHCKFIAFMPQWDFLSFIAEHAQGYPSFRLEMQAEVDELIYDGGRVIGLRAKTPGGDLTVRADLVVGADGRHSTVREKAGLEVVDLGAPMDVLWMRLSRRLGDPGQTLGRFDAGRIFVMLNRGEYWQCAFVIPKGGFDDLRRRGLPAFRGEITRLAPYLRDRIDELSDWSDVKLLSVSVDRLRVWHRPGLLCIGDAAHAMSPVGGVGINLAIQDAVAAANILAAPLRHGVVSEDHIRAVQRRRELPTRATQAMQVFIQNRVIGRVLGSTGKLSTPLVLRMLRVIPFLTRIPARLIGLGFRPEHVRIPAAVS
ncbi:MAG: FAD-dependent oxidoreductase [Stellaceae bacterium]|jgi:2-polyprenyl-6-methoxyphenol hydroxylase-like FAD-dependent oxidoreductase